jgi:hypothetical protein
VTELVSQSVKCCGLVIVSCCYEKLVAETGKGTSVVESRYRATASEDVTLGTSVCMCVFVCIIMNCKVKSRAVSRSSINSIINPKPVYSHAHTCDNMIKENVFGSEYVTVSADIRS